MTYDRNAHHRRSVRLKHHDYTQAGYYFVTLCTRDRVFHFADPQVRTLAGSAWLAIPDHAAGVSLDEWVLMPNHLHGLLALSGVPPTAPHAPATQPVRLPSTSERLALISPQGQSLAVIVRTYKTAVTLACRRGGHADFAWQAGYYEHIVRDQAELGRIRQYIQNNPAQWALDHDNPAYHGRASSATPWNDERV